MPYSEVQSLAHCRILVVEDEYFIADEMALALRAFGAEVIGPVPTMDKAIKIVESTEPIHAAILDVNLKGARVFPLADILGERGIPFVFATGYSGTAIPAAYEAVPLWEKPFDPRALAQALPAVVLPC
ncbi:response regulator [Microvirga zambiensis]|uniref:response regulator n=1 Tax=Microvirga zambiensis TaxID=1402137 RepID=UPI00191EA53B|nr:response regulator [Microvirga zambiensis]